jgi:hypothetical protein
MTIETQNKINQSHCYGIECYPKTDAEARQVENLIEQVAKNWRSRSLECVVAENQIHVVNPPMEMRNVIRAELLGTMHILSDLKIDSRLINQEIKQ